MLVAVNAVPDSARISAAAALQRVLPRLVALSLEAKQAHWNMTGRSFLPLHALTDELADDSRAWADRIAERSLALGFAVDARPATVAAAARRFPAGHVTDQEAVAELIETINDVTKVARSAVGELERADVVAHDILVELLEGLEKYRWMFQAQRQ